MDKYESLTDDELRLALKKVGINVPVNSTTRSSLIKKLARAEKSKKVSLICLIQL